MRHWTFLVFALAFIQVSQAQESQSRPGFIVHEWALDRGNVSATQILPYRPTYLIVRASDDPNEQPTGAPEPLELDALEVKFQFSLRGEFVSPETFKKLGTDRLRLWYAYTQQSNWQAFNTTQSRPFRDTNYEPEVMLTYDMREKRGEDAPVSFRPALVNLGLTHQSNGRSEPLSRTWWRLYLQGGWQTGWGSLLARTWHTFRDEGVESDNPDINDYVGRADLMFRSKEGGLFVLLRSNLRGSEHRGFVQVDWRLPRFGPLHVQFTHGYGESLLDYNYKQTTVGIGAAFWDW